jgi:hypothetical protein
MKTELTIDGKQDGRSELAEELLKAIETLDTDTDSREAIRKLILAVKEAQDNDGETAKSDIGKEIILKDGTRTIVAGGETKKEATRGK